MLSGGTPETPHAKQGMLCVTQCHQCHQKGDRVACVPHLWLACSCYTTQGQGAAPHPLVVHDQVQGILVLWVLERGRGGGVQGLGCVGSYHGHAVGAPAALRVSNAQGTEQQEQKAQKQKTRALPTHHEHAVGAQAALRVSYTQVTERTERTERRKKGSAHPP
jgi:hypothetical protein